MPLREYKDRVGLKVQDTAKVLTNAQANEIILNALAVFSKDCPIIQATSIPGDGGYDYSLPSGWQEGFSQIKAIEYPPGQQIPQYLEPEDYRVYDNATSKVLRFLNVSPSSSETFILSWTKPYSQSTIDSIPAQFIDAFCELAAALYCEALANYYTQSSNSSIEIDSVDNLSKRDLWSRNAKDHRKLYDLALGQTDGVGAASVTYDWDSRPSWEDKTYLLPNKQNR